MVYLPNGISDLILILDCMASNLLVLQLFHFVFCFFVVVVVVFCFVLFFMKNR